MARKVTPTTPLELALLQDADALLEEVSRYSYAPTPANWCRVAEAATSLSDTTFGTLGAASIEREEGA